MSQKNSILGELSSMQRNRVPNCGTGKTNKACSASLVRVLGLEKLWVLLVAPWQRHTPRFRGNF